jgi:hypothetical protein
LSRATKTRAVFNIVTMNSRTSPPRRGLHAQNLKIKIPKRLWNAYQPPSNSPKHAAMGRTNIPRLRLKLGVPNESVAEHNPSSVHVADQIRETTPSARQPASCKVKLWAFQYGGPKRVAKGASQNEVTYEQPCLQPTCANCWKWHPQLMQGHAPVHAPADEQSYTSSSMTEPVDPDIDPRILDGSWRDHQSRHGSGRSPSSLAYSATSNATVLTPVDRSFSDDEQSPNKEALVEHTL